MPFVCVIAGRAELLATVRSSPGSITFWALLGIGAGVFFFYRGFNLLLRKRLIMNTPASKVRSAAMGMVEISGLATGPYSLIAPITGVNCYYYRTIVWQWKRQGKSDTWVKEADVSLHLPFYVDDNTGRVLVNPQGAELDIHCDFRDEFSQSLFSSSLPIPANITSFLVQHGIGFDKKIKIEEYCIKPKNALFVLGTLSHNPGLTVSNTPVETNAGSSLMFNAPGAGGVSVLFGASSTGNPATVVSNVVNHPMIIDAAQRDKVSAAMMKAGITSPMAWAAAGISPVAGTSLGQAAAAAPAPEQFDLHPSVVLMKGRQTPFFISWRSQREVVKTLAWKSALMIWGGPALTLVSVYVLAQQYGWL